MNKELIQKLIKQSYFYDEPNDSTIFDREKFAELIVRECTNMLPEDSVRDANGVHMFYVIRKHFGVSEIGR
jgi:hypothetical protein